MAEPEKKMPTVKAHCNICLGEKNHQVLFKHKRRWIEEINPDFSVDGDDVYELLQCGGCDSIKLRHKSRFSEDFDENGPVTTTHYYPPAISRHKPRWFGEIITVGETKFHTIKEIMDEVYVALQNGSNRLATMGIRAIIETIMIDKVSDHGSFAGNLDELFKEGHISKNQKELLAIVLDAGHAATHRDFCPTNKQLNSILDICENVVEALYVNEVKTRGLSDKIPPRPPRKKKDDKKAPEPA